MRLWQQLLCHMTYLEYFVQHDRLRMCSLQWQLKVHWSCVMADPDILDPSSEECQEWVRWWMEGTTFLHALLLTVTSPLFSSQTYHRLVEGMSGGADGGWGLVKPRSRHAHKFHGDESSLHSLPGGDHWPHTHFDDSSGSSQHMGEQYPDLSVRWHWRSYGWSFML